MLTPVLTYSHRSNLPMTSTRSRSRVRFLQDHFRTEGKRSVARSRSGRQRKQRHIGIMLGSQNKLFDASHIRLCQCLSFHKISAEMQNTDHHRYGHQRMLASWTVLKFVVMFSLCVPLHAHHDASPCGLLWQNGHITRQLLRQYTSSPFVDPFVSKGTDSELDGSSRRPWVKHCTYFVSGTASPLSNVFVDAAYRVRLGASSGMAQRREEPRGHMEWGHLQVAFFVLEVPAKMTQDIFTEVEIMSFQ